MTIRKPYITVSKERLQIFFYMVFILLLSGYLQGQTPIYGYEKISTEIEKVEKGLSQNSVRTIIQDTKGFIWIGTWSGLNRFDGLQFKIFLPDVNNPDKTLSNQVINALAEDQNGFLWIGTEGGLNRLDFKSLKINHFQKKALHLL